jgi:hypothetical protein
MVMVLLTVSSSLSSVIDYLTAVRKSMAILAIERMRHRRANSAYGARAGSILLSINVPPVADSYDTNDESVIFDRVQDSVVSLPEAVTLLPRKLLGAW